MYFLHENQIAEAYLGRIAILAHINRLSISIEKKDRTSFGPVRIYIALKKILVDVIWPVSTFHTLLGKA
jgi:hypothetical protein